MTTAFGRARAGRSKYPEPRGYVSGPWSAVMDSLDPTTASPSLLRDAQNLFPEMSDIGTAWIGRPGFAVTGAAVLGTSTRKAQAYHEFVKLNGTRYRIAVHEGKFYTYDFTTDTYTDRSAGMPTLSASAQVALLTFADTVVFSDGVNTPFTWDGTSFNALTNCPVLYGKPWVYYDQLFGIKSTERNTIVWSEVNDPTVGYEAGGFNNAWTLGQSDQDPLTAGVGMNELMYVFRARSITSVLGTPGPDFSTSGTREGVSESIGTNSPFAVVVFERGILFLDADARPQRLRVGYGIDTEPPPWAGCIVTSAQIPRTALSSCVGAYDQQTGMIVFGVPNYGDTTPTFCMIFDAGSAAYCGRWTGFPLTALGVWTNADGEPCLVHGGPTDGVPYLHGVQGGEVYNDELLAATAPIAHAGEISPVGYDPKIEKHWDRVDLSMRLVTSVTSVNIMVNTPSGAGTVIALSFAGGLSYFDNSYWDTAVWSGAETESHGAVGVNQIGRWSTVRFEHSVLDETIGFLSMSLEAFALGSYPATP